VAAAPGELDPDRQTIVAIVGPKGCGKSKYARWVAASYPYDQVHLDLHGLDRPAELGQRDSGVVEIHEVPARWPEHLRPDQHRPLILYYQPDAASPTLLEDMDHLVGLAYTHGRCLLLVHEWGELARVHRTPPMTRRTISQGRKRNVTALLLMHRPYNVDPMTWVQADVVVMFELPTRRDRDQIADNIAWQHPPGTNREEQLELALRELEPYGYLQYDRRGPKPAPGELDDRLLAYPPLSPAELAEVTRGKAA
jgi:energy-coupling factor transporter ATP-binding protein EcfA2